MNGPTQTSRYLTKESTGDRVSVPRLPWIEIEPVRAFLGVEPLRDQVLEGGLAEPQPPRMANTRPSRGLSSESTIAIRSAKSALLRRSSNVVRMGASAPMAVRIDAAAPRPSRARGGRPPYPTVLMIKILVLQQLYNLADDALEYQLLDRRSFLRFLDLTESSSILDAKTIWLFRDHLAQAGVGNQVF